jgi:hypothetical protein
MPEPVTASLWLEQQLERAVARIDDLATEVEQLREALRSERTESARLEDELALLNGRTARHESTLDQVRAAQQQLAALEERIEVEASLRRDTTNAATRDQQRDAEEQRTHGQTLARLDTDLARTIERLASIEERQRHAAEDAALGPFADTSVDVRLDTLERRLTSLAADVRREVDGRAAEASTIPELRLALDVIEARTRTLQQEQQRLEDELAHTGTPDGLQASVDNAIEQARSLRERVELRLGALEAQTEETRAAGASKTQERELLQRQLAAHDEQLRLLAIRVEAQRETLIEHVRRATGAAEDAGRRQLQEIERQSRTGRELLTRLIEQSDEGAQEQPL